MTSIELVAFINSDRKQRAEASGATFPSKGFAELQHADLLKKALEVLGEHAGNFSCMFDVAIGNGATRQSRGYRFPKREACLMAMSYSYELQAKVFDRMTSLEEDAARQRVGSDLPSDSVLRLELALTGARMSADILRLEGSARLGITREAYKLAGASHLLPMLPVYAIDAPAGAPAVSSEPTESLTALMARFRVGVSSRAGNLILQECGLLEKRTRPSSGGATKSFWSITEKGQAFGKNVSSPENPRETQPHWFSRKGEELLRVMGVLE